MKGAKRAPRCLGQWPGSCRVVDQRGTARKLDTGLLLVLWGIWSGDFPAAEEVSPWGCFCFGLVCLVGHLEKKVRPPCPRKMEGRLSLGGVGGIMHLCASTLWQDSRGGSFALPSGCPVGCIPMLPFFQGAPVLPQSSIFSLQQSCEVGQPKRCVGL